MGTQAGPLLTRVSLALDRCATAQEIKAGVPFRQDTARALASTNTMDRWILAAANGATPTPTPNPNQP